MEIIFLRKAHKFIQKCNYTLYLKIKKEIEKIKIDPNQNTTLKGALFPIRSHHFFFKKYEYRIAYRIEDNIIVIMIATQENFYEKIKRL